MATLLLDMDDVLVDFVGGACAAHGVTEGAALAHWELGRWNVIPPVSKALGLPEVMTDGQFWATLDATPGFWRNLQPLPWLYELLCWAANDFDEWYVVTAPARHRDCVPDKVAWLAERLGVSYTDRVIPTRHKHLLARPGTILVDDRPDTVDAFNKAGGHGVLFPKYHNANHPHRHGPVGYVTNLVKEILP